jgi:hypothetical protein
MTLTQFENGYWYATELKKFAETIGIPSANKLRKDELEKAIRRFLQTGTIESPTQRSLAKTGIKDLEKGLRLELPVVNYTSNKETKDFIVREAQKIDPNLRRKSGARYRLNRWREDVLTRGKRITYGDLVKQYVTLNQGKEAFAKIPYACYVNFLSEFLAKEENATREQAIRAWKELKQLDIPKYYRSWVEFHSTKPK